MSWDWQNKISGANEVIGSIHKGVNNPMFNTLNKKISIGIMIVSLFYLYSSIRLPEYAYVPVDADVVPIFLGSVLLILSVILFFSKDEDREQQLIPKKEMLVFLGVLGFILSYIFLLEILGFLLTTTFFLFFCSRFLGYKSWMINFIVSVTISSFIYMLFNSFLQIQLPSGILPF